MDDAAPGAPAHVLSCFNASAVLCERPPPSAGTAAPGLTRRAAIILSRILQSIYAVRPPPGRHTEALQLEQLLDKWYIELPDALRYDAGGARSAVPPPHVLTLHMQYWTVVLLLHRPL